ncbi:MAG: glycosyltransferase N-terminal domain-containing protein [Bacteroidota bacterium]
MLLLYQLTLRLYALGIHLLAPFHPKARRWVRGRREVARQLQKLDPDRPRLWMHCASLGEFEQGRPVLEALRHQWPDHQIVLSFFSPSGYEIRKNYPLADVICYLPLDSPGNARRWLDTVRPQLAIFVKYEFWYHYLHQLRDRNCPTLLIAAHFRPRQLFFRSYGGFFRSILHCFQHIFVQDTGSVELLRQIGQEAHSIAGDPRIDRVLEIAGAAREFPLVAAFAEGRPVLVLGSSWPAEEQLLAELLDRADRPGWRLLIAPHEIREKGLRRLESSLPGPVLRYSQARPETAREARVLLIDNIGMLSALYRYGRLAFIGGGFGQGIHNILEPMAFGLPVIFGPRFEKFGEAVQLCQAGGTFSVNHVKELEQVWRQLDDTEHYQRAVEQTQQYLERNRGASRRIIAYILQHYASEIPRRGGKAIDRS